MIGNELLAQRQIFDQHKEHLLIDAEGKWAVIGDNRVEGVWDTYEDALRAGYTAFGISPFLVKRIEGSEQIQFIAWDVKSCPS